MNKHEKKFNNTHTRICKALLELIETNEYENISVSAICQQAQINRTTFYAHFQNIAEILDIINSGLLDKFINENKISYSQDVNLNAFTSNPYLILNRQDLLKFLTFVKSHSRLYAIIAKHRDILRLGLPENDIKQKIFIPSMTNLQPLSDAALDYIFDFYVAGTQKIISKWILDGCKDDEHDIIRIIDLCLYKQIS